MTPELEVKLYGAYLTGNIEDVRFFVTGDFEAEVIQEFPPLIRSFRGLYQEAILRAHNAEGLLKSKLFEKNGRI